MRELTRQIGKIEGRTRAGMQEVGLKVKGEAMRITPMRTGNLVNGAFYSTDTVRKGPRVRIGYTAKYAPYVHEMPDSTNWTKASSGPKFLERAVKRNTREIIAILRESARVR